MDTGSGLFTLEAAFPDVVVGIWPRGTARVPLCASSVQEFMTFTSQLIVERSELGSRASVKEQGEGNAGPHSRKCCFLLCL